MSKNIFLRAILLIVLPLSSSCVKTYSYSKHYPVESYKFYQDTLKSDEYHQFLSEIVDKDIPGINAEYAFVGVENGTSADSYDRLAKELELFPESETFVKNLDKRFAFETINNSSEVQEPESDSEDESDDKPKKSKKDFSILLLPPVNDSFQIDAGNLWLATMPHFLVEKGYYVFPPYATRRILEDDGMSDITLLHNRKFTDKVLDLFGADGVLYASIRQWDSKFIGVNTRTSVEIDYELVGRGGKVLWSSYSHFFHDTAADVDMNSNRDLGVVLAELVGRAIFNRVAKNKVIFDIALKANKLGVSGSCVLEDCVGKAHMLPDAKNLLNKPKSPKKKKIEKNEKKEEIPKNQNPEKQEDAVDEFAGMSDEEKEYQENIAADPNWRPEPIL